MTAKIKLTSEEMRYIALFESITQATVLDCLIDNKNERLIFMTKKGDMGLAIGKGGKNINTLRKVIGKSIEVVEHADNVEQLIKNSLSPARIKDVRKAEKHDKTIIIVEIDPKDKAIAIGRNGKTIDKTRMLAKRYFQAENILVT